MSNDVRWIISSSGRYMFVRFAVGYSSSTGFLAKIHYGNEIINQKSVQRGHKVTVTMGVNTRVMKVLKNLEYHHWHSLKSKLDYQWPTFLKRIGKEFEKQHLALGVTCL